VALDIFEFENYYILKAPIAGVKLSDLDIDIQENKVTIRGSRKQTDTVPEGKYYVQECFWGEFERSVTLPCAIDPKRVKATFNKESILKIIIPKEDKVKIIRIND
jgi:HSP20 family protein